MVVISEPNAQNTDDRNAVRVFLLSMYQATLTVASALVLVMPVASVMTQR